MANKHYQIGRRIEYKIIEMLEAKGFTCVRSAGSHGPWDICAIDNNKIKFIQSKHEKNKGIPNPNSYKKDMPKLNILAERLNGLADIELWVYKARKGFFIYKIAYGLEPELVTSPDTGIIPEPSGTTPEPGGNSTGT